ncbi:MAG: metallophosphoesterase [Caldithrix sp.]|nr:MAG: metallophosphoesterase [Caldithrix sp.]
MINLIIRLKYAIISDIHGNLEALESVIAEIEKKGVDTILCLGDVVGYGPNPNECVDIIRKRAEVILAGNHDYAPIGKLDVSYFNPWARSAIEWTADHLTQSSVDFLIELPLKIDLDGFTIVHATPQNPEEWNYINTIGDAALNFPEFNSQICFIGHSHVPMAIYVTENNEHRVSKKNPLKIKKSRRYIINVGSVGQPRDLNPKASFSIYDNKTNVYENFRVGYAVAETQRKIRETQLPEFLAERLAAGQ